MLATTTLKKRLEPRDVTMVLYHQNCVDGFAAAYVAWLYHQSLPPPKRDFIFRPIKQNYYAPVDIVDQSVLMMDVSLSVAEMQKCIYKSRSFLLLDHHITSEKKLMHIPEITPYCVIDQSKSGVRLAWEFFFPEKKMEEVAPFLQHIENRDLWHLPEIREMINNPPLSELLCKPLWISKLFTNTFYSLVPFSFVEYEKFRKDTTLVDEYVRKGHVMEEQNYKYIVSQSDKAVSSVFPGTLYRIKILNATHLISDIGSYLAAHCDFALLWYYDGSCGKIRVCLRSNQVDVSVIAESFGGGGHVFASTFECEVDYFFATFLYSQRW